MSRIDVYTPWREPAEVLEQRTVGRDELLDQLMHTARSHAAGNKVLPCFLFGPRGSGKSHLLSLLKGRLGGGSVPVIFVPEDVPTLRTAEELFLRVVRQRRQTAAWLGGAVPEGIPPRCVILFEALHKHLAAMNLVERRRFRARVDDEAGWWWVATGTSLIDAFTSRDEPLFGWANPLPVDPLSSAQGEALLAHLVPEEGRAGSGWTGRARTLTTLAGGSPRTLVALAQACAAEPEAWATEHLHSVVATFTAHYQLRFADLSGDGQNVVESLAESPTELTPTEIAERLRVSVAHSSKVLDRLREDGVLRVRDSGRNRFYTLAEPLFRYWHEYRTAPWEESRVGWVGRLVEAILSPEELARAWAGGQDEAMVGAITRIVEQDPKKALPILVHQLGVEPAGGRSHKQLLAAVEKAAPARLLEVARLADNVGLRNALRPAFRNARLPQVLAAWDFEADLVEATTAQAFRTLLERLAAEVPERTVPQGWSWVDGRTRALIGNTDLRGASWSLDTEHRAALAGLPVLRARYLRHGKRQGDAPLLSADEVVAGGLPGARIDWSELVYAAQTLRSRSLWSALIVRALEDPGVPVVANPLPELSVPLLAEQWVATMCARARHGGRLLPQLLTWAPSAARVSERTFHEYVEALALPSVGLTPPTGPMIGAQAALTRFAQARPDRLAALARVTEAHPWLEPVLQRAAALADTLSRDHLHPELATLRDLLAAGAEGPSSG